MPRPLFYRYMFAYLEYDLFTVASVGSGQPGNLYQTPGKVTSITNSSLEVKPGSLFVPLTDRRDGHEFIADAIGRGAVAFFARRGHKILKQLDAAAQAKAILVDDPLLALGRLAAFHRSRFSPLVIAVTGSNGKTTTKEMLAQIFHRALGRRSIATEKNYNNHIGVPFTLFAIKKDTRAAIIEMGMNHKGEIGYLSRMAQPQMALISSIGHAHIEFLGSRRNIAFAKSEILDGMPAGGAFFVPKAVAELPTLSARAKTAKAALKKIMPGKTAMLKTVSAGADGYELLIGGEKVKFHFANEAWLSNLSLAVAAAEAAGVRAEHIAAAVRSFKPPAGRMQLLRGYHTIIDDGYNANPDSAISSIGAALQIAAGKPVICVFGDFRELGKFSRSLHEYTGREAARRGVSAFYGVGDDMRFAVTAFRKTAGKKFRSYLFKRSSVTEIVTQLMQEPKGALILVKGSRSMQMEQIAAELLKQRKARP